MRRALLDDDVTAFVAVRRRRTADEFGVDPSDDPVPDLEWGEKREFRAITADGRRRIIVARDGADWWRIRYQIAHEVFHLLCTPPGTFHWTHELFAVETAVRALEELGEHEYAETLTETLSQEASSLPLSTMLTTPLAVPYPDGLYGRSWLTGRELTAAVGWERLKPLASPFDEHGAPDVVGWFARSTRSSRQRSRRCSARRRPIGSRRLVADTRRRGPRSSRDSCRRASAPLPKRRI